MSGVTAVASAIRGRSVIVLSGAGISTASGIPDYRGPDYRSRRRAPVEYREFVRSEAARRKYWARSAVGWAWLTRRAPNAAHSAVAELEARGVVRGLITQNVDGLHQAAGSRKVIDLHGRLSRVKCLDCGMPEDRGDLQKRMLRLNPGWDSLVAEMAPDGDADIDQSTIDGFSVPSCWRCGGVLKPDVVFFGENVPGDRVTESFSMLKGADLLFVLGSSLAVFSGYRFVLQAVQDGIDVVIVNRGKTRGDGHASLKVDAALDSLLPKLVDEIDVRVLSSHIQSGGTPS